MHIAPSCSQIGILYQRMGSCNFDTSTIGSSLIDYIPMSPNAANTLRHGECEPPDYRFKGDHPGIFLEFDSGRSFGTLLLLWQF
jgi:hypothetical protein